MALPARHRLEHWHARQPLRPRTVLLGRYAERSHRGELLRRDVGRGIAVSLCLQGTNKDKGAAQAGLWYRGNSRNRRWAFRGRASVGTEPFGDGKSREGRRASDFSTSPSL